jgi:hypothetical protein
MRLQPSEAVSLLKKYSEDGTLVQGFFPSRSGKFEASVTGQIVYSDPWVLVKAIDSDSRVGFQVHPGLVFEYGDSREAPPYLRNSASRRYESVLSVADSDTGEVFSIFEIKL